MQKTIIGIVIALIVGLGIYYISSNNKPYVAPVDNSQIPTAPVAATTVSIKNFAFSPQTLTVKTGTKVTWVNEDAVAHTVTSDSGNLLDSDLFSQGESFSFTFTNPGSESYYCAPHPKMKGTIVVEN